MGIRRDWAKCTSCGARRLVAHREWIRASRPRCLKCGGPIEISADAADEHAAHHDGLKEDRALRDQKTNRSR